MEKETDCKTILKNIIAASIDDTFRAEEMYFAHVQSGMLDRSEIEQLSQDLIKRNTITKTQYNKAVNSIGKKSYKNINDFIMSFFDKYNISVKASGEIVFGPSLTTYRDNFQLFVEDSVSRLKNREDTLIEEMASISINDGLKYTKSEILTCFTHLTNQKSQEALREEVGFIFLDEEENVQKRLAYFMEIADIISTGDTEIHAMILMKMFGQIKMKLLHGSQMVDDHIMPIFYGSQGTGKSRFVRDVMSQLGSFTSPATFKDIEDKRGYSKYINSAVLVFDEMERASSTDINTAKNFVTSDIIPVRPMGSNKIINLENKLTLVGTTNEMIEDMFRDSTGNRRFVQFNYGSKDFIHPYHDQRFKKIDFRKMWTMTHKDDDKIFKAMGKDAEFEAFISTHSYKEPFQRFMSDDRNFLNVLNDWKSSSAYYDLFVSWCRDENINNVMQKHTFSKKIKSFFDSHVGSRFETKIDHKQSVYKFV